jgi:GNAT superfamily N-acetyltransferase
MTEIRQGGPADADLMLAMLDGAVAWLVSQGRTGQWGTEPWSARPQAVDRIRQVAKDDTVWIADVDDTPAGVMAVSPTPTSYVTPADEPELYITLLVTDRAFAGHGIGSALLAHAGEEARRWGVSLVRVDCYAGDDGRLVQYYQSNGFSPVETVKVGEWPGQVLALRV